MFIGNIIFNFIGGTVRYIFGMIWRTILKKKKFSFKEYIYGPKNPEDYFDENGHTFVNGIVGFVTLMIICWIIVMKSI